MQMVKNWFSLLAVKGDFCGREIQLARQVPFRAGINVEKGHQDVSLALHPLPVQENAVAGYRCFVHLGGDESGCRAQTHKSALARVSQY
jgi:hypothetical protein